MTTLLDKIISFGIDKNDTPLNRKSKQLLKIDLIFAIVLPIYVEITLFLKGVEQLPLTIINVFTSLIFLFLFLFFFEKRSDIVGYFIIFLSSFIILLIAVYLNVLLFISLLMVTSINALLYIPEKKRLSITTFTLLSIIALIFLTMEFIRFDINTITSFQLHSIIKLLITFGVILFYKILSLIYIYQSAIGILYQHILSNNKSLSKNYSYLIVPKILKVAFQQYFSYFDDFVRKTKGEKINFQINKSKEGLEFIFEETDALKVENIEHHLQEYKNILFQNLNRDEVEIPTINVTNKNLTEQQFNDVIIDLKVEVRQMKNKIELYQDRNKQIKSEKLKLECKLEKKEDFIENLLRDFTLKSADKKVDIYNQNQNTASATNQTTINITNTATNFAELYGLLNNKNLLDKTQKEDAKEILNTLDELATQSEITPTQLEKEHKTLFTKSKRWFKGILETIKNTKTILIDTPKVGKEIIAILTSLQVFYQNHPEILKYIQEMMEIFSGVI